MSTSGKNSVTRRFVKKNSTQLGALVTKRTAHIAQNGALLNRNFFSKTYLVKICDFLKKNSPHLELIAPITFFTLFDNFRPKNWHFSHKTML
jgi:hypothetical protein